MWLSSLSILTLLWAWSANAGYDLGYAGDDSDLTSFKSRPEIKAPRFNVSIYSPERLSPGFWFIGPYVVLSQQPQPKNYYQPCQTGPAIYDQYGELVWSGACLFRNQNSFDFRAWKANGTYYLSSILYKFQDVGDDSGHGVILNNKFEPIWEVNVPKAMPYMNMHELNVIDNGKRALYISFRSVYVDLELHGLKGNGTGWVADLGFHEVDLTTDEILFEWWALDHISLNESTAYNFNSFSGPWPRGWNWIHLNSVDKNSDGDYMISARYTNAIYKISGKDGSILWTLGGLNSDFELEDGFNFSRQHDARFQSQKDNTEVITFLDNGGDEHVTTTNYSSSLVLTLDKAAMVAKVTKRWIRPGYEKSRLRGNFQLLPNGNAFTAWSDNCVISEHSWDGELLMEANFLKNRLVTYRAWKFNFTGMPTEPPALEAIVYGLEPGKSTTVYYVSWNGATEVASWNFYRVLKGEESLIGSKKKTGFETMFQSAGYEETVFVEGLAADGSVLGRSEIRMPTITADWSAKFKQERQDVTEETDNETKTILHQQQDDDVERGQVVPIALEDGVVQMSLKDEL